MICPKSTQIIVKNKEKGNMQIGSMRKIEKPVLATLTVFALTVSLSACNNTTKSNPEQAESATGKNKASKFGGNRFFRKMELTQQH